MYARIRAAWSRFGKKPKEILQDRQPPISLKKTSNGPMCKDCITDFKTYSNRVIKMEINLQGKDLLTVINAYAPTFSAEDEKVEQFYDDTERAMADSDSKYQIITGDFNAKIGTKTI